MAPAGPCSIGALRVFKPNFGLVPSRLYCIIDYCNIIFIVGYNYIRETIQNPTRLTFDLTQCIPNTKVYGRRSSHPLSPGAEPYVLVGYGTVVEQLPIQVTSLRNESFFIT